MKPGGSKLGLRMVALLEGIKGVIVLVAAIGLPNHQTQRVLERITRHFLLNAAPHHKPGLFQRLLNHLNDGHLWWLAAAASAYAIVRLAEAYGLWFQRRWAEWLGCVGAALYIPVEIWHLCRHPTWLTAAVLLVNVVVVVYLAACLRTGSRKRAALQAEAAKHEPEREEAPR